MQDFIELNNNVHRLVTWSWQSVPLDAYEQAMTLLVILAKVGIKMIFVNSSGTSKRTDYVTIASLNNKVKNCQV